MYDEFGIGLLLIGVLTFSTYHYNICLFKLFYIKNLFLQLSNLNINGNKINLSFEIVLCIGAGHTKYIIVVLWGTVILVNSSRLRQ